MANLFQTAAAGSARPASPTHSEVGSDDGGDHRAPSGSSIPAGRGVFRREEKGAILKGRGPVGVDPRKFKYDVVRGRGARLGFTASRDDRMSAEDAGNMLDRIHRHMGVDRESEGVLKAFDDGLFFCHTVNGGSVLNPGRSTFSVPGVTQAFDFGVVRDILGTDQRRFFRAFADDIISVNKAVLSDYDQYDPESAEKWGWLQQVAFDRGLTRYPYLAHDSADACLHLSPAERAAVSASKGLVISTSVNAADAQKPASRVQSVGSGVLAN